MTTTKKTTTKKAAAKKPSARSGNPAARAAAKTSSASDFKKLSKGVDLPLPSGLAVRAKRVDLGTFLSSGNVPNPLMGVVTEALEKGQNANVAEMIGDDEGKVDFEMVKEMYEMVNKVVISSVVDPKVHEAPEDPDDRDDDLLYVDEVDDEDKMFIYQWAVGGTSDIETFRREARADLDAVAEGQGGKRPAQPADRLGKR